MAKKKRFPVRYLVQVIFFIFIAFIAIRHLYIAGGPEASPSIHAYCPFGAIESLYNNLVHGTFVWKVQYSSYVMFIAVVGISLLFGKGFCGWICPFGSFQEWIRIGGAKLSGQKKSLLPQSVDAGMRYLKYGVVLLIVIPTYITGRMVFENYDPFVAFFHFGKNITRHLQPAYIILGVVVVFSLFIGRFWCRYFCPLGAILGLLNKISFFSIKRVGESCTDCELCDRKCPVDIQLSNIDRLKSAECIACLESEQACPQKGALLATTFGRRYSLGSYTALLLVFLFLAIGLARLTGYWQT
ncbi:MAG: 4Fe-4S binding protein, partial [Acidobacteriota bacterium]